MRMIIRFGGRVVHIVEQDFTGKRNLAKFTRDLIVRYILDGHSIELVPLYKESCGDLAIPEGAD